jgi:hypothetical protein
LIGAKKANCLDFVFHAAPVRAVEQFIGPREGCSRRLPALRDVVTEHCRQTLSRVFTVAKDQGRPPALHHYLLYSEGGPARRVPTSRPNRMPPNTMSNIPPARLTILTHNSADPRKEITGIVNTNVAATKNQTAY